MASWQKSIFYSGSRKMSHPKKTETSNGFETIAVAHFEARLLQANF